MFFRRSDDTHEGNVRRGKSRNYSFHHTYDFRFTALFVNQSVRRCFDFQSLFT